MQYILRHARAAKYPSVYHQCATAWNNLELDFQTLGAFIQSPAALHPQLILSSVLDRDYPVSAYVKSFELTSGRRKPEARNI